MIEHRSLINYHLLFTPKPLPLPPMPLPRPLLKISTGSGCAGPASAVKFYSKINRRSHWFNKYLITLPMPAIITIRSNKLNILVSISKVSILQTECWSFDSHFSLYNCCSLRRKKIILKVQGLPDLINCDLIKRQKHLHKCLRASDPLLSLFYLSSPAVNIKCKKIFIVNWLIAWIRLSSLNEGKSMCGVY